jgi:peptidylprolyl isomerase
MKRRLGAPDGSSASKEKYMQLSRRALFATALIGLAAFAAPSFAADPDDTMIITLKGGEVRITLRPDLAPKHVAQIKKLVRSGAYDGVAFHRVIAGFMAQTGDNAELVGTGGSDLPDLPAEFSKEPYVRGTVGMARSQDPDSANSQFFIMFAPAPSLEGDYTVIGNVESGMEFVDRIKKGDPAQNGAVADPDSMIKVRIASDAAKK